MDTNNEKLAEIVAANGQWIADNANAVFLSQWLSAASAAMNEKEVAEYKKISESMMYSLTQQGSSVSLKCKERETSPYREIIENGMEAPLSGGSNGTVTEPDGTMRPSNVPQQLWGTSLPEYAREPNPISDGIQQMLKTLVPEWVKETIAESKKEIAEALKNDIARSLHAALIS